MSTRHLAEIAVQAEQVRLHRLVAVTRKRAIGGLVGAAVGVFALVYIHVVGYAALSIVVAPHWAALIVMATDLVLAGVLFAVALRGGPDAIAAEAMQVRSGAWDQLKTTLAGEVVILLGLRALRRRGFYSRAASVLTESFLFRR